ncbi:MAG: hypothetical protein HYS27_02470 [Deltaproteobacteria bacterium]|nr:hypothetical protein [Deltaproteobacteria bacterium]
MTTDFKSLKQRARDTYQALTSAVDDHQLTVSEERWNELAADFKAAHGEWYRAVRKDLLKKPGIIVDFGD